MARGPKLWQRTLKTERKIDTKKKAIPHEGGPDSNSQASRWCGYRHQDPDGLCNGGRAAGMISYVVRHRRNGWERQRKREKKRERGSPVPPIWLLPPTRISGGLQRLFDSTWQGPPFFLFPLVVPALAFSSSSLFPILLGHRRRTSSLCNVICRTEYGRTSYLDSVDA